MFAYGKELLSARVAGASGPGAAVATGPAAGGDRRWPAAGALHGDARDVPQRLEGAVRARSPASGRRVSLPARPAARTETGQPTARAPQADPRHSFVAAGGGRSPPGLEPGSDCAHTGPYARSGAALRRDDLQHALCHAAG